MYALKNDNFLCASLFYYMWQINKVYRCIAISHRQNFVTCKNISTPLHHHWHNTLSPYSASAIPPCMFSSLSFPLGHDVDFCMIFKTKWILVLSRWLSIIFQIDRFKGGLLWLSKHHDGGKSGQPAWF